MVTLCAIFGANPVAIKISLAGLGPLTTAAARFAIAAIIIFFWAMATRRPLRVPRKHWMPIAAVGGILTAQISLFYVGMTRAPASHGAILSNLLPFFVLIAGHYVLKTERVTVRKLAGMVMAFTGVAVMLVDKSGLQPGVRTGDYIILAALALWAGRIIATKIILADCEPFHLVLYPFVFAAPLFGIGGVLFDPQMIIRLDVPVLLGLAYQSVVVACVGFIAWNTLLKKFGAASLHAFIFIMPIAGVCFSAVLLGEAITPHLLTALVLVVAGLLVIHYRPLRLRQAS
ncbi:DMT family transporter [Desulfosarcina cetonica]